MIVRSIRRHYVGGQKAWCKACLAKHPEVPLGPRVKTFRIAADLGLADLADRHCVMRRSVADIERGLTNPPWRIVEKLLRYFGSELLPPFAGEWNVPDGWAEVVERVTR